MKTELIWNVCYHNFNRDKIEEFNVFQHSGFMRDLEKIFKEFKKSDDKDTFVERIDRELHYYFWSKCEWEVILTKTEGKIIISPWVGSKTNSHLDVTDNKDFNWTSFYEQMKKKCISSDDGIKIDVYNQIRFHFDEFIDYCWNNR